MSAQCWN